MGVVHRRAPYSDCTLHFSEQKVECQRRSPSKSAGIPSALPVQTTLKDRFQWCPCFDFFWNESFVLTDLHPRIGLIRVRSKAGALCKLSRTDRTVQRLDYVILSDFIDSSVSNV